MSYTEALPENVRAAIDNPKRAKKADLLTALLFLRARLDATESANITLRDELRAAHDSYAELQDEARRVQDEVGTSLRLAQEHITSRGELLRKLREFTAQGVPCVMRGGFIKHRITGAVLAQVRQ